MFRLKLKLAVFLVALFAGFNSGLTFAANAASEVASAAPAQATEAGKPGAIPEQEEHGLSQKAVEIGHLFGFPITNSMVVTWIVALGLIIFAQACYAGDEASSWRSTESFRMAR